MKNTNHTNKKPSILLGLIIIFLIFPILTYSIIGTYSRFAADDFQFSSHVKEFNIVEYVQNYYQNWTGRFSYLITTYLIYSLGISVVPILPTLALILLLFSWFCLFLTIGKVLRIRKYHLAALSISLIIILVEFASLDNIRQVLYWPAGMMNYVAPMTTFPIILSLISTSILQKTKRNRTHLIFYILVPLLSFLSGAYNELFSVVQIIIYSLITLYILIFLKKAKSNKKLLVLMVLTLGAAIISTIIVILAPGNSVRKQFYPPSPSLTELVKLSTNFTFQYIEKQITQNSVFLFLAFFIPLFAAMTTQINNSIFKIKKENIKIIFVFIPLISLFILFASFSVSAWATSSFPVSRTLSIIQYFFVIFLVIYGVIFGILIQNFATKKIPKVIVFSICFVLIILGPIKLVINQYQIELPEARLFSNQWDRRDALLRTAGQNNISSIGVENTINYYDLEQLEPRSNEYIWVNAIMSNYYQIDNIYLKAH